MLSQSPLPIGVPGVQRCRIEVEIIYVLALKLLGDDVVRLSTYDTRQTRGIFGAQMDSTRREAMKRLGRNAICIPMVKKPDVPESEFLAEQRKGKVVLRRHGMTEFSARPMRLADLDQAPTLDVSSRPEVAMGDVALVAEPSQARLLASIQGVLLTLAGASDSTLSNVDVSSGAAARATPGVYRCKPAMPFVGLLTCPETVTVVAGDVVRVPIRLERIVPVRVRVVDEHDVEHQAGRLFLATDPPVSPQLAMVVAGGFSKSVHWVRPGRVTVTVMVGTREAVAREFTVAATDALEPVELRMVVP